MGERNPPILVLAFAQVCSRGVTKEYFWSRQLTLRLSYPKVLLRLRNHRILAALTHAEAKSIVSQVAPREPGRVSVAAT